MRDFRVLWIGQVVSALGARISGVAFPLLTLQLTHSATKAGAVGFAGTLPLLLLTLHAGVFVDRHSRRRLMVACEVARAVALGSVVAGVFWGFASFDLLLGVAVVEGVGFTLFEIAQRAALRQLVPVAELPTAAAMNQGREYGALLVGLPLGGVLYALGRAIPFLLDAISYVASALSILLIRAPLNEARDVCGERSSTRVEMSEGFRWLWSQPFLRAASLIVIASDLTVNALFLVVVVLAKREGASPQLIGAILVFSGVGGLIGSLLAPHAIRRLPPQAGIYATLIVMTALVPVMVVVRTPVVLGALYGAMFVAYPTWGATVSAYRAALVPDRLQGRVQSVATLLSLGAVPVALLVVGAALQHFGGTVTLLGLLAIMVAATSYALMTPAMRVIEPLTT